MKKTLFVVLAFFALMGILNCTVLEPAFAHNDEASHSESQEDSDCCFIHCSACHQWTTTAPLTASHDVRLLNISIPGNIFSHPDSVVGTIFHPPIAS